MIKMSCEKILKKAPFGYALQKILLGDNGIPNDFEYIEVNEAFEKLTGLNKDKIIGKKITEVLPNIKNNKFDWIKCFGDIAINDSESEFEQYSEELDRWYKIKVYSPEKYYVITYFIDITNEVKERELFKSMLLSITEGIIATDLYGKIIIINETAERITGWKKEDILNKKIFDVFKVYDDNGENKITDNILNIINNGEEIREEENLILKSKIGIDIPVVYNISPVKG